MLALAIAETKRSWKLFLRYPAEAIAVFMILTLLFAGLFLGARYLAGPEHDFGVRMDSVVIGYVAWLLVLGVFSGIAGEIEQEAKTGTLEQIALAKSPFLLIAIMRVLANLAINIVITLAVLGVVVWLTGSNLALTPRALPSAGLLIVGATGLGLTMGAVALLLKKTVALIGIAQLALLFLILYQPEAPKADVPFPYDALPLVGSASLLRAVLMQTQPFQWQDYLVPALNAVTYLAIGCLLFVAAFRKARRDGSLGHY